MRRSGFNEAGPQGAGKPAPVANPRVAPLLASMRPARKGPENNPARPGQPHAAPDASMRPARKGPENFAVRHHEQIPAAALQ